MTDPVDMAAGPIFTIGHSNHSLEGFLALLAKRRIAAVADVRSAPYSRFSPHFDRKALAAALEACGIGYRYFGRELGGRPDDPGCYENGRVSYDRVARTGRFRDGLARVREAAAEVRLALMCAEKEPLDCHRRCSSPARSTVKASGSRTSSPTEAKKLTQERWSVRCPWTTCFNRAMSGSRKGPGASPGPARRRQRNDVRHNENFHDRFHQKAGAALFELLRTAGVRRVDDVSTLSAGHARTTARRATLKPGDAVSAAIRR